MRELIEIDGKQYLSVPAAARRLGITMPTVRKWARAGMLPPLRRIGLRCCYLDKKEMEKAMRALVNK
jgi:excisionase family DNA binding protein